MTSLPIDYRNCPYKPKYIFDETTIFNRWMTFGVFADGSTTVCDADTDVVTHIPLELAQQLVKARDVFCDEVQEILSNFDEQ